MPVKGTPEKELLVLLNALIAQLAEHAAVNRGVEGSSPSGGAYMLRWRNWQTRLT